MARLSIRPITRTFALTTVEDGGNVTIRQARTGDLVKLGDLFAEQTQIWDTEDGDTIKLQKKWNPEELKRERARVTITGCDLVWDDDSPIFRFREGKNGPELAMSQVEFNTAWGALPPEVSQEIYEAVVEMNPSFNPAKSGE